MNIISKMVTTIVMVASICIISTQIFASTDDFYAALAKTQKQQYTEAIQELTAIGNQFEQKGDLVNAYRSQDTALVISYIQDLLKLYKSTRATFGKGTISEKELGSNYSNCWGSKINVPTSINGGGCNVSVAWVKNPTINKKFGGLLVFTNVLGYFPDKPTKSTNVLGYFSTKPSKATDNVIEILGFLDTVVVPKLNNKEGVELCKVTSGDRKGRGALALFTKDYKLKKYSKIRQAWYPDFQTKRIQSISSKLVNCPIPPGWHT